MKRTFSIFMIVALTASLCSCSKQGNETVFDTIRNSPAAKLELSNGSFAYVDGEIASLTSFADLDLMKAALEPTDSESDWLYRIIFNPSEKVQNADEITVSFHEEYIQINSEYYLTAGGVPFDDALEWVESKFGCFMR